MESIDQHFKDGVIDFVAGSLGGTALVYVGQPLDTVKVKMQAFPTLYSNMFSCFISTLKTDGLSKGLYAGTVPALLANITENSILFLSYGLCQKLTATIRNKNIKDLNTLDNAYSGCLASFFSSIAICPSELIKCKLQAMYEIQSQDRLLGKTVGRIGPLKLLTQIWKQEGTQGLFKGLVPLLAREMPGYFFFFGGYEGTRELLRKPNQTKEDIGLFKTMIAGAVGGSLFWILTYPVDVAKSRIQVYNSPNNMFVVILRIWKDEGPKTLFNGLTPTVLRTIPATATLFVTYEYSKKFLNQIF